MGFTVGMSDEPSDETAENDEPDDRELPDDEPDRSEKPKSDRSDRPQSEDKPVSTDWVFKAWEPIFEQQREVARRAFEPLLDQKRNAIRKVTEPILERNSVVMRRAVEPLLDQNLAVTRKAMEPIIEQTLEPIRSGIMRSVLAPLESMSSPALKEARDAAKQLSDRWILELEHTGEKDLADLMPPNLRDVRDEVWAVQLVRLVRDDGIPVYWSLAPDLATKLVRERDQEERKRIISDTWISSADQCQQVIDSCSGLIAIEFASYVQEGIATLRAGHVSAAQSLFTTCLDLLTFRLIGRDNNLRRFKQHRQGAESPAQLDASVETKTWVWLPTWHAHEQFDQNVRSPIPPDYNRHATVHAISPIQYTRANTVVSMMLVTSLVAYAEFVFPGESD